MQWYIVFALLLLWAMALISSYTLGGFVHVMPVAAVAIVGLKWWNNRDKQSYN